jgi:PBP1b-binding outer membrane lipoprotein LpoB
MKKILAAVIVLTLLTTGCGLQKAGKKTPEPPVDITDYDQQSTQPKVELVLRAEKDFVVPEPYRSDSDILIVSTVAY